MSTLAERLKAETRNAHTAAERSRYMGALLRGRMDRAGYCALLRNLHAIYASLEPALARHARHPAIAPVFLPALWRSQALADDLTLLHGPAWPDQLLLQPAAAAYVRRLNELDAAQPGLLLAHAYVRYLGDLSGGQMLRRIVASSLDLRGDSGVAFYVFGDEAQTRSLTLAFREGLDRTRLEPALESAVVEEALLSFRLHQQLFDGLAHTCGLDGD